MLIVGSKGFAKEILQIFYQIGVLEDIVFFDDINLDLSEKLYNKFSVIRTEEHAKDYFSRVDERYILGVGNPHTRRLLSSKMDMLGGKLTSIISPKADIGAFNTVIGKGVNIMTGTVITNDVLIGDGCLINLNCTIGHDTKIGNFTELSPGVHVSGRCNIGEFCSLGTGAVILPKIAIGNNVTIGAGAVVIKDITDGQTAAGVPAKVISRK